jgi:hypothetical protein
MAWLLAGSLFYLVGIIAVTIIFNVPLNDALAAAGADTPEGAALWTRYLTEWTAWNHVRTVSGIAALACFIMALGMAVGIGVGAVIGAALDNIPIGIAIGAAVGAMFTSRKDK